MLLKINMIILFKMNMIREQLILIQHDHIIEIHTHKLPILHKLILILTKHITFNHVPTKPYYHNLKVYFYISQICANIITIFLV